MPLGLQHHEFLGASSSAFFFTSTANSVPVFLLAQVPNSCLSPFLSKPKIFHTRCYQIGLHPNQAVWIPAYRNVGLMPIRYGSTVLNLF